LGSGSILNEVIKAAGVLAEKYDVAADVWSVTSYNQLRRDALAAERWNMLHPKAEPRRPYVTEQFAGAGEVIVAASDYLKALPDSIAKWLPTPLVSLGTDGFGRSESREALRDFFEVDHRYVAAAALWGLARAGRIEPALAKQAVDDFCIDLEKADPLYA